MTFPIPHRRSFLLALCLTLTVLADFLFYDHPLGWPLALFLGIAAAAVTVRTPALWRGTAGRIILALTGLILFALVEEPSPLAILMSLLCLGTLVLIARGGLSSTLSGWLARWLHLLIMVPLRMLLDRTIAARWFKKRPQARPTSTRVVRHWIIPLLAGSVFLLLFTIANPIIQQWASTLLTNLITVFDWFLLYLRPDRLLLWLTIGLGSYGLLRYRSYLRRPSYAAMPPVTNSNTAHYFIIRCLIVFNAVFALQTLLDLTYLFGGVSLPPGMTYTQYAHRGAYPLVATALLAGIFVLITFRTGGPAHRSRLARQLVYLWIAQNLFLMFSTIWRTWHQVNVSLLTRLRLSVFIWVFLIALGFVYIIIKIRTHRSNAWLWIANTLTLLVVLYLSAFINFDGIIADFNVRHCREVDGTSAPLDIAYLLHLGPASLPAIDWIRPKLPQEQQATLRLAESRLTTSLATTLTDWRGWTLRRQRLVTRTRPEPLTASR